MDHIADPIDQAIYKYSKHPSTIAIKEKCASNIKFSFQNVTETEVLEVVMGLDSKKATVSQNIPTKHFKQNIDLYLHNITNIFNCSINECLFPTAHKKGDVTDKSNYRPVRLLSCVSKVFEKLYSTQINKQMEQYFSKHLCGFKYCGTQYCMLLMLENIRKALDNKIECRLLLTDLPKAFGCVKHDLIISKMHADNFDYDALILINSYLSKRMQRTKINSEYSSWHDIIIGVPQGSNLGPILFNIYINDIFFTIENVNIANFADDNSLYIKKENG